MRRGLLVVVLLGAAAVAVPAQAASYSVRNPLNGCTYTVFTPNVIFGGVTPVPRLEGQFGESSTC